MTQQLIMLSVFLIITTVILLVTAQQNLTPFGTASQSSSYNPTDVNQGKSENAMNPPISNKYSLDNCISTKFAYKGISSAWWMFEFSFHRAYITDITIYYRENYAIRMDGFKLYVTNTSTFPPVGYLCYEDEFTAKPPYPTITQTIPCHTLGQYVIYYDDKGSNEVDIILPVVELCYVAINGCQKTFWGTSCDISCAESCIEQHCFPGNGSCIFGGCSNSNCLKSNCDRDTAVCTEGCRTERTGSYCDKYNLAFGSSILFNSNGNEQPSLATDGNITSCVTTSGAEILVQVDLKEISIVAEIYITLIVNTTKDGNHNIYASNNSNLWKSGIVLYKNESSPTVISVNAVFRYLTYISYIQNQFLELEVCEIGIVGCPPKYYGPLCSKLCPVYCSGPCDLETGNCAFGCANGWIGDKCELGPICYEANSENLTTNCSPEIYKVFPVSGPINGGTLLTISGNYLGNINDNISIDISGVQCHNVTVAIPYSELSCVIGQYNSKQTTGIFVSVNANRYSDLNAVYFTFKEPQILNFSPKKGILSGNTTVAIQGQDIDFEGQNRYSIYFCDGVFCIECSETRTMFSLRNPFIKCKTGISTQPHNMTHLNVVIDDLTVLTLNETFQYLPDPKFNISTEIPKALESGGALFTIRGEGFHNVGEITVERVDNPCDVPEDTSTECETPPRLENQPHNQTIDVHFDGVTIQFSIEYVDDPTFEMFQGIVLYDKESLIEIKGRSILNVARRQDYHIKIGLDGICLITDISMDNITCLPPKSVPRTNHTDDNSVYVIVNVIKIKVYIGDLQYKTETITENGNTFVMIIGILVAGLVVSIIIGMSAVLVLRRKKTKAATEFKMKLKAKEDIIQKASIEGERIANLRREDGNAYTEPDESIYDEINSDEEKNTRGNSYLDVNEGYDELGQRSPRNPYNQLQQTRDDIQRLDIKNNETITDDQLQNNKRRNDYLSLFSGYEKPISRNDPQNQFQQESADNRNDHNDMSNLD